jgi:nitrogen fixation protein NifB
MHSPRDPDRHPCFNAKAKGEHGRVHLPVAPKCNIQCHYCNRKYDCVNESRPGVASSLLSPEQALVYVGKVLEKEPRISVAGIAGPGDPFACADETLETLRLIRNHYPDLLLCVASNGLGVGPHVEELARIGVSHVTLTINAVDTQISQHIYAWVRDGKVIYRGKKGAELLLQRQIEAVRLLKQLDILVKVNVIVIPGINDHHIRAVAATMKGLGADMLNCMAMFPNADTVFEHIVEPGKELMERLRCEAEQFLPQMRHCTRCRADAVGLLDSDRTAEMRGSLATCARLVNPAGAARPYVAVATHEGVLVSQHLGEATRFQIWGEDGKGGYRFIEERKAPPAGGGRRRWIDVSEILADCRAILVNDLGDSPREVLTNKGIQPVAMAGFIERGLEAVYGGRDLNSLKGRLRACSSKGACTGGGAGCG